MAEEIVNNGIRHLREALSRLEQEIAIEAEAMKGYYIKAAAALPEDKSYFLNGIQTSSVVKSYLLTRKGIEVHEEGAIPISDFIDSVLRFANYPNRRIEVLSDLATHLQNIFAMIASQQVE
jgi:hypothetical protein